MSDSSEPQGEVWWFAAACSRRRPARVYFSAGHILAVADDGERRDAALHEIKISSRLGQVPRRLVFADGTTLVVADNDHIDAMLRQHGQPVSWLHRWESKWRWLFALAAASALLVVGTVEYGVPAAAAAAARAVPHEYLRQISDSIYANLKNNKIIRPSTLAPAPTARVQNIFSRVADGYDEYHYRLQLHDFPTANAFALPDGLVIATDRMIEILDEEEITAVFAHEIGHVEHRHGIRALAASAGVFGLLTLAGGDATGLLAGAFLLNLKYSRDHERDADCFAYHYLRERGMSGALIGRALQKMEESAVVGDEPLEPAKTSDTEATASAEQAMWEAVLEAVSTHPHTESRKKPAAACSGYSPAQKS